MLGPGLRPLFANRTAPPPTLIRFKSGYFEIFWFYGKRFTMLTDEDVLIAGVEY